MALSAPEIAILKKYRIMNADGSFKLVPLSQPLQPGGPPPGNGPLMSADTYTRLLKADTTPDKRWLDWIFFQAGGGEAAKASTADALKQIKDRFVDERVNGWTRPDTGKYIAPVPREEAEARWVTAEPCFRDILAVCDQDAVRKLHTFGYFRDWPGNGNKYALIVEAMKKYLGLYSKLLEMNTEVTREGGETLPVGPEGIPTHERMLEIAKQVDRYFASKKARTDVRIADNKPIYDDDTITALAPLTYAASVRFGFDAWPWANRAGFDTTLQGDPNNFRNRDEWKERTTKGSVFVYLTFKVPVPAWVARKNGNWELKDLHDLALELGRESKKANTDEWLVHDQENRNTLTIAQVKQMILDEPTRNDPTDEENLHMRGGNVYSTPEEAAKVVASLDRAVKAVKKWFATFDPKSVKTDALTLD
jgi:hypothetical protein